MNSRRGFLRTVARSGIAVSLAWLGGTLLRKTSGTGSCPGDAVCGNCGRISGCSLPEADHYRFELAKKPGNRNRDGRKGK